MPQDDSHQLSSAQLYDPDRLPNSLRGTQVTPPAAPLHSFNLRHRLYFLYLIICFCKKSRPRSHTDHFSTPPPRLPTGSNTPHLLRPPLHSRSQSSRTAPNSPPIGSFPLHTPAFLKTHRSSLTASCTAPSGKLAFALDGALTVPSASGRTHARSLKNSRLFGTHPIAGSPSPVSRLFMATLRRHIVRSPMPNRECFYGMFKPRLRQVYASPLLPAHPQR